MQWLEILEKEFDTAFVDLDILLGQIDDDQQDIIYEGRNRMTALSGSFAQLVHKSSVIFGSNSRLEKELSDVRKELIKTKSENKRLHLEAEKKDKQLDAIAMTYNGKRIVSDLNGRASSRPRCNHRDLNVIFEEMGLLRTENISLRKYVLSLQSELYGARLASKYLDKELAGRIQQIQLLGKSDLKGADHDRLWNQLESEIHLHRHKVSDGLALKELCRIHVAVS